jgi:hypothetical protein
MERSDTEFREAYARTKVKRPYTYIGSLHKSRWQMSLTNNSQKWFKVHERYFKGSLFKEKLKLSLRSHGDSERGWHVELTSLHSAQLAGQKCQVICAECILLPRKIFSTHFCRRLNGPQAYWMRAQALGHLKISRETHRKSKSGPPILVALCLNQLHNHSPENGFIWSVWKSFLAAVNKFW